jgi:putative transposase
MEKENTEETFCRKIRFYPTTKHKILLEKCFGATRFLINQALGKIKDGEITKITNPITIRNTLKYQDKYLNSSNNWLKEIPFDTRDGAIRQLCSNFKSALTHLKKKLITNFKMKFKSKRNPVQICFLNKNALNVKRKTLFVSRVGEEIKFKEDISDFEFGNLTIVREKNKYYMCFPLKRKQKNVPTPFKAVALDPGVRTFQTFYSEEGLVGKLGNNTNKQLKSIYKKEDILKSKLDTNTKIKKNTRYNIKKRCFLLRTKVKNVVKDLHRKACSWITSNFKYVFLPSFNVSKMVKKENRNLYKPTVRSMLALSHFSFKERLISMGKSKGCKVIICNEAYTSKTCGLCGYLNNDLGGSKLFSCSKCNLCIDRDYNGARNIYLRNTQN